MTAKSVTCPLCLDTYPWDESELLRYSPSEGKYNPVELPTGAGNANKVKDERERLYVRCPNPSGDSENHYLPAPYIDYPDPLVVAVVGRPRSGKTHLIVAMIRELLGGSAASRNGLRVKALDHYRHSVFKREFLDPFEVGVQLAGTAHGLGTYLAWLVVEHGDVQRPLVFFDVAGEDFRHEDSRRTRFLVNANAVLFVEDVPHVVRDAAEEQDLRRDSTLTNLMGVGAPNEYFQEAISRMPNSGRDLPAAVALTKSDRLRYFAPVDRWLRADPDGGRLDADRLLAESRDCYALLHAAGSESTLRLYNEFKHCTMHFVSATGGAVADKRYPAGIRPSRVLTPLLALFAMAGLITGPEAGRVGR